MREGQNLENYSFDFSAHNLPKAYEYFGASVQLHHKVKLIPDVKDRYGAVVLKKRILSDNKFQIDVEFKMNSDEDKSHGFEIMLTQTPANFPEEFHPDFGYKPDYKGLGVFLYRSEKRGKWVSKTIQFVDFVYISIVRYRYLKQRTRQHHSRRQKP